MYHGLKFDPTRQVHPDPGPGQHPAQARRAQLPGGRARPPGLDLDGRSGARPTRRRSSTSRYLRDPRLARHAGLHALRRELPADRRQPVATSRTSPSCTPRRSAARRSTRTRPSRSRSSGCDDGFRVERWHMNATPPPFHKKVIADETAKRRPPQHRPHAHARHLLPGDAVRAGRHAAPRRATSQARKQYRNCQFMTPETRAHDALLLELPAQLRPRRPEHRAVALQQPDRGLHGGQGDHRGAAEAARRRPRHDAGDRRRRAAGAFPPRLRPAARRRAGRRSPPRPESGSVVDRRQELASTSGSTGFCR